VDFWVQQNYPNPFNGTTVITFGLESERYVRISVTNILGQEVAVLSDGIRGTGIHQTSWTGIDTNGRPVTSGLYFYNVDAGGTTRSGRMMLIR
jgi:flagellar hook assembly protein FlgD